MEAILKIKCHYKNKEGMESQMPRKLSLWINKMRVNHMRVRPKKEMRNSAIMNYRQINTFGCAF